MTGSFRSVSTQCRRTNQDRYCPLSVADSAAWPRPPSACCSLLGLLQQRPVWTGPELAERLGVTTRSVRRDVERLRALGYPVQATQGVGGGYQLGRGKGLPPLLLDDAEAVAVAVSLRMAAGGTRVGRQRGGAADARQARPGDAAAAARRGARHPRGDPDPRPRRRRPSTATPCCGWPGRCRDTVRVRFDYEARDKTPSSRSVEPVGLVATGRRWYLMAFDLDRDDWRTFRLDRMTRGRADHVAVPASGSTRTPRPTSSGPWPARRTGFQARVLVHAPLAEVAERTSVRSVVLTAVDERHDPARGGRRDPVRAGVPPLLAGLRVRGAGAAPSCARRWPSWAPGRSGRPGGG